MLHNYKNFTLILESVREEQLKIKYINKLNMPEDVFNKFYQNKNAEWLLKTYINTDDVVKKDFENKSSLSFVDLLIASVEKFDKNKSKLIGDKINDIVGYDEMSKTLNKIRDFDDYDNLDEVYVNSYEWFIFNPITYEMSKKYANNRNRTKNWCTTYDEDEFNRRNGEYGGMLYFINKLDYKKDIAFEITDGKINVWDYNDDMIKDEFEFEDAITIWKENEEPYVFVMEYIDTLKNIREEKIPNISKLSENAKDYFKDINFSVFMTITYYNNVDLFDYVDDTKFLINAKEEDIKRISYTLEKENDLLEHITEYIKEDYYDADVNDEIYFKDIADIINDKNLNDEYDTTDLSINIVINFIENVYDDDDVILLIDELNLRDEIAIYITNLKSDRFTTAKEYLVDEYGDCDIISDEDIDNIIKNYLDQDDLINDYVDGLNIDDLLSLGF